MDDVVKDFQKILALTYRYCKYHYDDDNVAVLAQQINAKAYQVMKHLEHNGSVNLLRKDYYYSPDDKN